MFTEKNKWKVFLIVALIVIFAVAAYLVHYMMSVNSYQERVRSTIVSDVDTSEIPDGSYTGEYDVGFIYAKVEVYIESGKITDIHILEHRNDRGMTAESIVDSIISNQTIDVDAVSGATNSSTVIKKAIESALLQD